MNNWIKYQKRQLRKKGRRWEKRTQRLIGVGLASRQRKSGPHTGLKWARLPIETFLVPREALGNMLEKTTEKKGEKVGKKGRGVSSGWALRLDEGRPVRTQG